MELNNLVIGYGASNFKVVVDHFPIEGGQVISILGVNGCGKSTFYRTLLGEIAPIEGTVPEGLKNEIAIVSDRVNVPDDCKVGSILGLVDENTLKQASLTYPEIYSFVNDQSSKKISSLSSGQKRILQIFLMLASGKKIIIMDEACAYLDLRNKQLVFDAIKSIVNSGATVLYTSHELEDLSSFNSYIYLFKEGRLSRVTEDLNQETLKAMLIGSTI